jgi:phosphoserine phosphatase RsbU/P
MADDYVRSLDGAAREHWQPQASASAILLRHWAGHLLLGGTMLRAAIWLLDQLATTGPAVEAVRKTAGVAILLGAAVVVWRLSGVARHRLLWRVRRKLVLSYVFIGLVPVLLICAFFAILGALSMLTFSSYLVTEKLADLQAVAEVHADTTAAELRLARGADTIADLLTRKQQAGARTYPGMSLTVVPVGDRAPVRSTSAGPWEHGAPPTTVPSWLPPDTVSMVLPVLEDSAGTSGARLIVRSVAWTGADRTQMAVMVDLPLDDAAVELIRSTTGIRIGAAAPVSTSNTRDCGDLGMARTVGPTLGDDGTGRDLTIPWMNVLVVRDWPTGGTCTLGVQIEAGVHAVYRRVTDVEGMGGAVSFSEILVAILLVLAVLFLIIQGVALVMGVSLARSITGAVHELFEGTQRVQREEFSHRVHVPGRDQLGALAASFNQMTERIEELLEQKVVKDRLEQELQIARDIQTSLLPSEALRIDGVSVAAACRPAREIGGDYCDFFPLDDHRLGLLVADVSGKGASAALYMAELKGLVLALSKMHDSPRRLLSEVNGILAKHLGRSSFITMTYAVLDLRSRTLTHARAGHTPLIHLRAGDVFPRTRLIAPEGLVLGVRMDSVMARFEGLLEEQTLTLRPGDVVVMFTDGVSEAMNDIRDLYGEDRLCLCVEEHAGLDPEALCDEILESVREFAGTAEQHDDMTMIVLKLDDAPRGAGGTAARAPVAEESPA